MDIFNVIAGLTSIIALGFALWQTKDARDQKREMVAMLEAQSQSNRSASRVASIGAATADLIVQRTKAPNVTASEIGNLARTIRGTLLVLASELDDKATVMKTWRFGKAMTVSKAVSQRPSPATVKEEKDPGTVETNELEKPAPPSNDGPQDT